MRNILLLMLLLVIGCKSEKNQTSVPKIENSSSQDSIGIQTSENSESLEALNKLNIDTLLIYENINIRITKTNASFVYQPSSLDKELEPLLEGEDNAHRRAILREKLLIEKYNKWVKKDSAGLHVMLANNEWKLLELDSLTDEIENTFENYFEDLDLYFVRTQWHEGSAYEFIHKKDGQITTTFGEPYFSYNKEFVLSTNVDLVAEYTETGFDFFQMNIDGISQIGSYYTQNWGPSWAKAVGKNKFIVHCVTYDFNLNPIGFFVEVEFIKK